MIGLKEMPDVYLAQFAELETRLGLEASPRLRELRREALACFEEFGFPTTRNEHWKFTNAAPIARATFRSSASPVPVVEDVDVALVPFARLGVATRLVFVNGRLSRALSTVGALPAGVSLLGLSEAFTQNSPVLEQYLGRLAAFDRPENAFTALNTAFLEDGAFLYVPRGTVMEEPVQFVFVSTTEGEPQASHPRNLIVLEAESQAKVIEVYGSLGEGRYFANVVTEAVVGEAAVLEHYKIQQESVQAYHAGTLQVDQKRSSSLVAHNVAFGGALVRNNSNSVMNGEGCECTLNGLYVATGEQHVDNQTILDHARAHCSSREYYKGVLDGKASGVFNGGIIVRADAQKTDAIQSNKNLLLSEDATINTKPQLEIWADDVRCTHGATIGQLDAEAIFYLQARGIGREDARRLLTYGFANDVIGRMTVEPVRAQIERVLFERLSGS